MTDPVRISYADLPGFPVSAVSGHAGEVVAGKIGGVPVIMLSGPGAFLRERAMPMRCGTPIEVLKGSASRR
jgi:purine-nucleoside phosphorylase